MLIALKLDFIDKKYSKKCDKIGSSKLELFEISSKKPIADKLYIKAWIYILTLELPISISTISPRLLKAHF